MPYFEPRNYYTKINDKIMQSKGAIRFIAILIALACIWQLMFTVVTKVYENKAVKYADNAVEAYKNTKAYEQIPDVDKAYVLDSIREDKNKWYIDSIATQKVYFGYTFDDVREKEMNLGLDLKGGMNVMLQVQLEDVVQALAENNLSPEYTTAFNLALERSKTSGTDFITLFDEAWKETAGGQRLSNIFIGLDRKNKTENKKLESTDEEIIALIRAEAESAIANSFEVLRNRVDRFGVTQPNIQKVGNTGRILVELPGVKEPERVRKLLQGTASLEFWTTYETSEIFQYMTEANNLLAELQESDEAETAPAVSETPAAADTTSDILAEEIAAQATESAELEQWQKQNPLFAILTPPVSQTGSVMRGATMGYAHFSDTAKVNRLLEMPEVQALFPEDLIPMWSVKPVEGNQYELVAIRSSLNGEAALKGERDQKFITDARVQYNGANPEVSMSMSAEASKVWARITKDNIIILANNIEYAAKNTIIACGSKPLSLDLKCNCLIDSDELLQSCNFPSDILIIGSGAIGIEWARLLNSFGSKVTIVEKATSLAPLYDKDVSSRIERMLKIAKINFYKNTVVQDYNDGKAILSNKKEVNCQKILCAIGRKSNLPYIHGGIPIEIYENCETNIKNLYVIGDASGIKMLAHAATFQAKALFETIYNNKKFEMPEFPSVIYGMPEIASVGIREQDIKNIDEYKIYKLPILRLPKSWCDNETEGFIKIITKNSYIEGAHIISKEASALISQICIAMKAKMSIDELKNIIFPHPTYSEGIIEALENE